MNFAGDIFGGGTVDFMGDKPRIDRIGATAIGEAAATDANKTINDAQAAQAALRAEAIRRGAESTRDTMGVENELGRGMMLTNAISGAVTSFTPVLKEWGAKNKGISTDYSKLWSNNSDIWKPGTSFDVPYSF